MGSLDRRITGRRGRADQPTGRIGPPRVAALVLLAAWAGACGTADTPAGDDVPAPSPDSVVTTTSTEPPVEDPTVPSADELPEVLAAAAARRVQVDNSFGGGSPFELVAVVETLGTIEGSGFLDPREGRPLTAAERAAILAALAPVPVEFVPATVFDDLVPGTTPGGGWDRRAVLTLAEPAEVEGRLAVVSQLWCGDLCGIGGANELVRDEDGTWSIGDPVGGQWIS